MGKIGKQEVVCILTLAREGWAEWEIDLSKSDRALDIGADTVNGLGIAAGMVRQNPPWRHPNASGTDFKIKSWPREV
jgi:hypothetical protein